MFPVINHINDVLPAIKDRKDFIHVIKDGYQVIDYVYIDSGAFDDPIRAECRGIKFDLEGNIIARPLHKFKNFGEESITYPWNQYYDVMTKLDGSMIHAARVKGEIVFMTRMGRTEHALKAEERHLKGDVLAFCDMMVDLGVTPIFEWTAPDNQIVIPYEDDRLTLLALRNNTLGIYEKKASRNVFADIFNIPVVESHSLKMDADSIRGLQENVKGIEGYVVFFPDTQQYVKIKTDEYVTMHRAVSFFDREDMILEAVLDSVCDDIYPTLSVERADKLREYEADVLEEAFNIKCMVNADIGATDRVFETRKDFALWVQANVKPALRSVYFSVKDGKDIWECVKAAIKKHPELLETRWT